MSEWSKEPDLRPGSVCCVGSNPTGCNLGAVAQMVERMLSMDEVLGSMPSCSKYFFKLIKTNKQIALFIVAIAQLGERKTEDLEVIGSIPIGDIRQLGGVVNAVPC